MSSTNALRERKKVLRHIDELILATNNMLRFSFDELCKLQVRVVPVQFNDSNENTKLEPLYFDPYPHRLLSPPRPDMVDLEFPEFDPHTLDIPIDNVRVLDRFLREYLRDCGTQHPEANTKHTIFYDLGWRRVPEDHYDIWEHVPSILPQWFVQSIYYHIDDSHFKSTMISDLDGDEETLLRGEVLALVRMIRKRKFPGRERQPVLLFSMVGVQHLRILQAHWDGKELVIQKSPLYDLRHKDDEVLDLCAAWYLSRAVGDTSV